MLLMCVLDTKISQKALKKNSCNNCSNLIRRGNFYDLFFLKSLKIPIEAYNVFCFLFINQN